MIRAGADLFVPTSKVARLALSAVPAFEGRFLPMTLCVKLVASQHFSSQAMNHNLPHVRWHPGLVPATDILEPEFSQSDQGSDQPESKDLQPCIVQIHPSSSCRHWMFCVFLLWCSQESPVQMLHQLSMLLTCMLL